MKKLLVLLVVGSIFSMSSFAQEAKQGPTEWDKQVKEQLKLTPEQIVKYDALSKEYKEKFDAVMNDAGITKEQQKEKKMALKKEKENKLFAFITPEQQSIYKEMVEKKKKDMEQKSGSQ